MEVGSVDIRRGRKGAGKNKRRKRKKEQQYKEERKNTWRKKERKKGMVGQKKQISRLEILLKGYLVNHGAQSFLRS
jgi:hypothetical protein